MLGGGAAEVEEGWGDEKDSRHSLPQGSSLWSRRGWKIALKEDEKMSLHPDGVCVCGGGGLLICLTNIKHLLPDCFAVVNSFNPHGDPSTMFHI